VPGTISSGGNGARSSSRRGARAPPVAGRDVLQQRAANITFRQLQAGQMPNTGLPGPTLKAARARTREVAHRVAAFERRRTPCSKPAAGVRILPRPQLLNVMFGGTLLQDIATQRPGRAAHARRLELRAPFPPARNRARHAPCRALPETPARHRNSIHHQAIRNVAPEFVVEAHCPDDDTIEAVRWTGPSYVPRPVQPEFHDPNDRTQIDDRPMLRDFLAAARPTAGDTMPTLKIFNPATGAPVDGTAR